MYDTCLTADTLWLKKVTTRSTLKMAKNNNKKVTVIDVAKYAGVSKSTVSLVLRNSEIVSQDKRDRVNQAISELGYVYNREAAALRSKTSNLVALVINDLSNPYSAQIAIGLEQHIAGLGLVPVIVNAKEDWQEQQRLVRTLQEYNVAAFILCPVPGTTASWMNELVDTGTPVISIMREVPYAKAPVVIPDNRLGAYLSTRHAIEKGHKKIAFVGGVKEISDYLERLAGYKDAMAESDLTVSPHFIMEGLTNRQGGREATVKLLESDPDISAIICFNDVIAYGVLTQLRQVGLTPGEGIGVIGFDDLEDSSLMAPALTSVHIGAEEIGKKTCELLALQLEKQACPSKVFVNVELVVRDSCNGFKARSD